ncbi:TIR domain-containing protein [Mycobacterium marinum]|uniref:TIR domain-containing protein n=1 Tax=Mycobacterium marinum TaxID=1781 RepID=UPI002358797F|nr:TIR domain-containing protein [Mycobacterium marinum]MDC9003766.1 nucleotide-binding protein [Mycobacterium marinum]
MATKDEVVALLKGHYGLTVAEEKPIQNAVQVITQQGPQVVVYNSGKVVPGGSNIRLIADLKDRLADGNSLAPNSRKVFVVYGHDMDARTQLEAMLRRWDLEPILLDQLTTEGDTLIEKLERSMNEAVFAVVLVTPDDEGHPKGRPDEKKFRARQNVVLELGMMLRGLGRKKVAILLPQLDVGVMEKPSDIDGLIYIPYTDNVDDGKVQLAKELNKQGLSINLNAL